MDVVFAVMPFADAGRPALGVSLLKAAARRAGYSSAIVYGSLQFAARIGTDLYAQISSAFAPDLLVGEWFFADDLFGQEIPHESDYLQQVLSPNVAPSTVEAIRNARSLRKQFLEDMTRAIAAHAPRIVGFTTTFHQTCASIAVARRLKSLPDPPIIVFGGANCEGEMGEQLLASFSCIDYVCRGEADVSFPALLDHLLRGGSAPDGGVVGQSMPDTDGRAALVRDLEALPYPEYDDYFEQLRVTGLEETVRTYVVVETSRGCWWGAKHHCTFCGLNGETMAFRSKTPDRAYDEIVFLARRYGVPRIGCVDNILDMHYIDTLFPRLATSGLELDLFYEVKANLRREQLLKMYAGGMRQIQPGIESFSDQVLQLMRKGVTGVQNIQLLRWCKEVGIECAWNLLGGFPQEDPAEYGRMAELIPLLTHLDPPCSAAQLRLDRFSPFHAAAQAFGFRKVRPARAYFYVFPFSRKELQRLAYFFDFDYQDGRDPQAYLVPAQQAVQKWWETRRSSQDVPRLEARFEDGTARVLDTRPVARCTQYKLSDAAAKVLLRCDTAATFSGLMSQPDFVGRDVALRDALDMLLGAHLIAQLGDRYLSLPVFVTRPAITRDVPTHVPLALSQAAVAEPLFPVG